MALISCPECQKEVSDRASTCPLCGFPVMAHLQQLQEEEEEQLEEERRIRWRRAQRREAWISLTVGVIILIIVLTLIANGVIRF